LFSTNIEPYKAKNNKSQKIIYLFKEKNIENTFEYLYDYVIYTKNNKPVVNGLIIAVVRPDIPARI
jgi:hypothetical protein